MITTQSRVTLFIGVLIVFSFALTDCTCKKCSKCELLEAATATTNANKCEKNEEYYEVTNCRANGHGTYNFQNCQCDCDTGWGGVNCDEQTIAGCGNTVNDIDGNTYNVIQIGTQCWMKENLKTARFKDGSSIPSSQDSVAWLNSASLSAPVWCNHSASSSNDALYGKLYNWYAVTDSRGVCPTGWHVPTEDEVLTLTTYLGGSTTCGGKMKATTLWDAPNEGANNSSGFTALPGGSRSQTGNFTSPLGYSGAFWTSTSSGSTATTYSLSTVDSMVYFSPYNNKGSGKSIRCIKD